MTQDYRVVGPNAQTLFLGCSISEITTNLAWGAEESQCSVKLVQDMAAHENSTRYIPLNTKLNSIVSQGENRLPDQQLEGTLESQELLKQIAKYEKDKLDLHNTIDRGNLHPTVKDLGKKLWDPHSISNQPLHWLGPDPGFLGETYSIMGIPAQVRFQDLKFCGFIKKWTYDNAIYSVDLIGPGSLLKGTKLILNDYFGTIASTITASDGATVSVPYNKIDTNLPFNSSLRFGNIPNCINVFGYLEDTYGFGASGASDLGVRAGLIYDALQELLSNFNSNPFSPYGGLLSRGLMSTVRSGLLGLLIPQGITVTDPVGLTPGSINLTHFGLLRTVAGIDTAPRCLFKLDIAEVPRPDNNIYYSSNLASVDEFISFCCSGAGFDWNAELIPDITGIYTGIIKIRTYSRNEQFAPRVLKDFLRNNLDSRNVVSYNFGEEFKTENVRKLVLGGKQKRLYQVTSHTLSRIRQGKIFNPNTGGWLATPSIDGLARLRGSTSNTRRDPYANSQRMRYSYRTGTDNSAVTAQEENVAAPDGGIVALNAQVSNGGFATFRNGNYKTLYPVLTSITDALDGVLGPGMTGQAAYPIHFDLISPFLGRHSNGIPRKVFYDRKRKQLLVNVLVSDMSTVSPYVPAMGIGTGVSSYITISENEIRAALTSFDAWLTYVFEFSALDLWLPVGRLILSIVTGMSPEGFNFRQTMLFNQTSLMNSIRPNPAGGNPPVFNPLGINHPSNGLSSAALVMSSDFVRPVLVNIHNFIVNELGRYYGKSFLVRMPFVRATTGDDGVSRFDWEITDSGWEEKGNFIDDLIEIGSDNDISGSLLSNENGTFGPIVGWNTSTENIIRNPVFTNAENNTPSQRSNAGNFIKGFGPPITQTTYNPVNAPKEGVLVGSSMSQKFYLKAKIEDIVPSTTLSSNTQILWDSVLNINYCVISTDPLWLSKSDKFGMMLALDLCVLVYEGEERAQYGSMIDLAFDFNRFIRIAQFANLASGLLFLMYRLTGVNGIVPGLGGFGDIGIGTAESAARGVDLHPRLAMPCFAAIPIQYNNHRYGPWSTAPFLVENLIFPGTANPNCWANNVIGGVDVEINPQYVPWEYGGNEELDKNVLSLLGEANEYQQIEETGSITLAGIMLNDTAIGSRLQGVGPVCNSVVVTYGSDGVKTTYSFRTFSRKLGYFNKENAELLQKFNKQQIALKAEFLENLKKGR